MIVKHTYSLPVTVWSPTASATTRQISSSGREIAHLKLISTGGAAHISLYDNAQGVANTTDLVWVLDSSTQSNDDNDFSSPLSFKKGIYAVCDDGFNFAPQLCLAYLPDQV